MRNVVVRIALLAAGIVLGVAPMAHAQIYLHDSNIANFTGPITSYATFSNFNGTESTTACGGGETPPFTPTSAEVNSTGCRVFGGTLAGTGLSASNNWIEATFSTPVSTIVVFPSIDHLGDAFDGYQYSIAGSKDGTNWTMLFDALTVNGTSEPFTLGTFSGTAPLFVNNVVTDACYVSNDVNNCVGYIAFFDFGTTYKYYAFGASTVATGSNPDQELSAVGTGPAAITQTLRGNGATNTFAFFPNLPNNLIYNVIYPANVSVAPNITMTVSPNVLAQVDCNSAINIPAFSSGEPTCTTYTALNGFSAVFDVACSVGGAPSTSEQCPTTTGFNPYATPPTGFHNSQDINNILVYASTDPTTGIAPQMLTAPEVTPPGQPPAWVPYEIGFNVDPTRGSGGSSYNSMVVAADFPTGSSFSLPQYVSAPGFFLAPILPTDQNFIKRGRTLPIKFCISYPVNLALGFNGGPVTNLNFPPNGYLSISIHPVSTASISALPDNLINTSTNAGLLNLGNGCYNFGWVVNVAQGSYTVTVEVGDGQLHTFAVTVF
jgi:hypothetical protein